MVRSPLQIPNFRLLFFGQSLILCGVQFWLVALTWLVLNKIGSGFAVATVLAAAAVPRALFMLVGGAISDRFPPNRIAALFALINTVLVGTAAILVYFDAIEIGYLVVIAALYGLSDAFLYPAMFSMVPRVVNKSLLGKANALTQGGEQIMNVIGPAASGAAMGSFGLTTAFAINTGIFALGSFFIYIVRRRRVAKRNVTYNDSKTFQKQQLTSEIVEGLRYTWRNPAIRISLLTIAMLNFALLGPLVVGGAELARTRFGGDASTFGSLQAAYGLGTLLGVIVSSKFRSIKNPGISLVAVGCSLGIGLIIMGFVQQEFLAYAVLGLMGLGGGIVSVIAVTWMQQQTAARMQGRMMSLLMFAAVALDPFSQAVSGVLIDVNLTLLFVAAGCSMLLTAALTSSSHAIRHADN